MTAQDFWATFPHPRVSLLSLLPCFPPCPSLPNARHVQYCPDEEPAHDPHRWVTYQYVTSHPCHLGGPVGWGWAPSVRQALLCPLIVLIFKESFPKPSMSAIPCPQQAPYLQTIEWQSPLSGSSLSQLFPESGAPQLQNLSTGHTCPLSATWSACACVWPLSCLKQACVETAL